MARKSVAGCNKLEIIEIVFFFHKYYFWNSTIDGNFLSKLAAQLCWMVVSCEVVNKSLSRVTSSHSSISTKRVTQSPFLSALQNMGG